MRLQNLKISGFKSFPERSDLVFDDGVTAIVGPNGCGKSNVIDAITWVLGEQSAKSLRGERMEDVIFSGSDGRKPIGTAEVTLYLAQVNAAPGTVGAVDLGPEVVSAAPPDENGNGAVTPTDDADIDSLLPLITRDVEVGRRLYRSGESEYLIDGRVCRLRDIQDLLMDSGVGVKAYAVIEQGKIGQILGARPAERRQLLEEAAGVTKYKSRRRSAELKLDAAQQNLTRVDDIVYEVEKQRRALKRQAAKARRYRRLREELRRWETVGFGRRHQGLTEIIASAMSRLDEARERERLSAADVARVEGDRERHQIELAEAENAATRSRDTAHALELEVERRQQQITFESQQIETVGQTIQELEREVADLQAKREPARTELVAQEAEAERCGNERDEVGQSVEVKVQVLAEAQRGLDGLEGDVEAARSEVCAASNAATALRHAVEHAVAGQTRLGESLAKLDAEAADLVVERKALATTRDAAEAAERDTREAISRDQAVCAESETDLRVQREQRDSHASDLRERERQLASLSGRLTSLRDLEKSRADYSDAARLLLSQKEPGVNHLGSVADHLEVEPGRERAVEACLGDLLQYVVVPTRGDAENGLAFVRDHGVGRAGFLIAEEQPLVGTSDDPFPGLEPLINVVRVSGAGEAAVSAVLAGRWLAPDLETAARAAAETTAPIATPVGDVFRGMSLVDGGMQGEGLGILATKREVKELKVRIDSEQKEVEGLTAELAGRESAIRDQEHRFLELQGELQQHEKSMVGHELQRAAVIQDEERLARKEEVIGTERRTVEEEREAVAARRAEAEASIERLEREQTAADDRFTVAQRRVLDAREAIDTQGLDVAEAKAGHAALVERAAALESSALRLKLASQELDGRLERRSAGRERAETSREALISSVAEVTQQLDSGATELTVRREEVRTVDERVVTLRDQLELQDREGQAVRTGLDEAREVVARLDIVRANAERDLSHLGELCRDALQVTLEEVAEQLVKLEREGEMVLDSALLSTTEASEAISTEGEVSEDLEAVEDSTDTDEQDSGSASGPDVGSASAVDVAPRPLSELDNATVEQMVSALKGKIDRLGPVNMMAIEEFDDLDERYEFLTSQRQDLVESISATGAAIARINKTTRERFREAFDAINAHFQDTFATLFGGGRAGLELLDETDLLESGIDIIAQPPGKRLQSIQLLSGGEKALSAMALMFAIFKYKPSPFCMLDEIDAPLDEANIGRFIEMLRGMQSDTQFILVTHNRKTMEIADRLYGVTMEEPGVSKLISVQLGHT